MMKTVGCDSLIELLYNNETAEAAADETVCVNAGNITEDVIFLPFICMRTLVKIDEE
jgi:hypothetical protein